MKRIFKNIILVSILLGVSAYILLGADIKSLVNITPLKGKGNTDVILVTDIESLDNLWLDNYEKYLYEYAIGNTSRSTLVANYKKFYESLSAVKMNNKYKIKLEELLLLEINYIEKEPNLSYIDIIRRAEQLGLEKERFRDSLNVKKVL
ncbi:hypothetical protein ABC382_00165 [Lysinibacillus sp. 1P01SD]|uniref:hypothetical protein n=1 Tax=Lysinibacillus sp. 1P01SD TaxID=3132285 RepID=UPI0039A0FF49